MNTQKRTPRAPKNIRPEAKELWKDIHTDFDLDPAGYHLLTVAVISLSRFHRAREIIDDEGEAYKTSSGQRKKHPAVEVEKNARQGFLAAMKALNLDYGDEPQPRAGRPLIDGGQALI